MPSREPSPTIRRRLRSVALIKQLGPGLSRARPTTTQAALRRTRRPVHNLVSVLLWTMVLTYPLMSAVRLISAKIGRVTGKGLAANLGTMLPSWAITALVGLLFLANTINLGADLAAMGAAAQLVVGSGDHLFTLAFAVVSLTLQLFIPYKKYASVLKWLTLVLLAYVAVIFMVDLDGKTWRCISVWPDISQRKASRR